MVETKRWVWPAIGVVTGLLILWGLWGEGTASKLFPEPDEPKVTTIASSVSSSSHASSRSEEEVSIAKKYDASLHDRGKPLPDPFHSDAIEKEKKSKALASTASSVPETVGTGKKTTSKKKDTAYPKLLGVMSLGPKRRALVEWQGESHSVVEGEQVGIWTVSRIEEKTAVLIGPPGTLTLSTR